jgi:mono/diheme cytochrome c family protein
MSTSGRQRLALCALGLGTALATAGCDEDFLNPMAARQPRVNNYSGSDFYQDGMGMREPPAGTVPRSRLTGNPGLTTGKEGDKYLTTFPVKVDDALLRLGQKRFNITCGTCHGPLGDGDSIVAHQMALRPPPSLIDYAARPVGYIFEVASKGHGLMASYAAELPVNERWAVVAYVRALQVSRTATLDKAPVAERARLEAEPAHPGHGKETP